MGHEFCFLTRSRWRSWATVSPGVAQITSKTTCQSKSEKWPLEDWKLLQGWAWRTPWQGRWEDWGANHRHCASKMGTGDLAGSLKTMWLRAAPHPKREKCICWPFPTYGPGSSSSADVSPVSTTCPALRSRIKEQSTGPSYDKAVAHAISFTTRPSKCRSLYSFCSWWYLGSLNVLSQKCLSPLGFTAVISPV